MANHELLSKLFAVHRFYSKLSEFSVFWVLPSNDASEPNTLYSCGSSVMSLAKLL
uniref:Uncharacterized protein n=1 Tax=Arundo donax TaxID=35708 RepID=A0A0A9AB07_ARUDO